MAQQGETDTEEQRDQDGSDEQQEPSGSGEQLSDTEKNEESGDPDEVEEDEIPDADDFGEEQISPSMIRRVTKDLEEDRGVRCHLPGGGVLHIDRPLPFLVVFRGTGQVQDIYTKRLIRSEASVLVAADHEHSADEKTDRGHRGRYVQRDPDRGDAAREPFQDDSARHDLTQEASTGEDRIEREQNRGAHNGSDEKSGDHQSLKRLVRAIVRTLSARFGAFLIIEVWTGEREQRDSGRKKSTKPAAPVIRLMGPEEVDFSSVTYLKRYLEEMRLGVLPVTAVILPNRKRYPPNLPPLLESDELKRLESLLIGVEISPFYINPETGSTFPLIHRKLGAGLSQAFRKTLFEFVRIQTSMPVTHFQMLGRRRISPDTWEIDESLARITDSFKFLLLLTPINISAAWSGFRENRFETSPRFQYRLLPVDPELLKRELYNIPIEQVEDPALARLFRDKRHEVDTMLTLLADRGRPDFLLGSLQLYGRVDEPLLKLAEGLLAAIPPQQREKRGQGEMVSPETFARMAREEISYYRNQHEGIDAEVHVQDDVVGMIVSKGHLYIGSDADIPANRAEALLQHEVGTHILTWYNGKAQPLRQLYGGLPGYESLQEGLAVLSEYLVGGLTPGRLRLLAARVVAVQSLVQGADFVETFRLLHNHYDFGAKSSFTTTMRVFRGGGLTKDAIYLKGLVHLLEYLGEGRELEPLLIGKIHEDYLPLIQELLYRRVLQPPPITPRYLTNPTVRKVLTELKPGKSVMNLV